VTDDGQCARHFGTVDVDSAGSAVHLESHAWSRMFDIVGQSDARRLQGGSQPGVGSFATCWTYQRQGPALSAMPPKCRH